MLSDCRNVDILFKVNDVSAYLSFMLESSSDKGLAFTGILRASKVLEHSFVRA